MIFYLLFGGHIWYNKRIPGRAITKLGGNVWTVIVSFFRTPSLGTEKACASDRGFYLFMSAPPKTAGSPHLQYIFNPLLESFYFISANTLKSPFTIFRKATEIEVNATFEDLRSCVGVFKHPEHPHNPVDNNCSADSVPVGCSRKFAYFPTKQWLMRVFGHAF